MRRNIYVGQGSTYVQYSKVYSSTVNIVVQEIYMFWQGQGEIGAKLARSDRD